MCISSAHLDANRLVPRNVSLQWTIVGTWCL
jgi:hypothetical protein